LITLRETLHIIKLNTPLLSCDPIAIRSPPDSEKEYLLTRSV
jgi:hypothetical protein